MAIHDTNRLRAHPKKGAAVTGSGYSGYGRGYGLLLEAVTGGYGCSYGLCRSGYAVTPPFIGV